MRESDGVFHSFSDVLLCVWFALPFLCSYVFLLVFLSAKFPLFAKQVQEAKKMFDKG